MARASGPPDHAGLGRPVVLPQSRLLLDRDAAPGEIVLFVAGFVQSFCMIPMAVLLLRVASPAFRGRVMGVRMLAVYGMAIGLLAAGPLIEHTGFAVTGTLFSLVGIVFTVAIGVYWRRHLWHVKPTPTRARGNPQVLAALAGDAAQHRQVRHPRNNVRGLFAA